MGEYVFKCYRYPERGQPITDSEGKLFDEFVEWLNTFPQEDWEGDDFGLVIYRDNPDDHETILPGDWVTSIPDETRGSGERLVRLPATGRRLMNCIVPGADESLDIEMELWAWALPNGQAVILKDGRTPVLVTRAVDLDQMPLVWLPEDKK